MLKITNFIIFSILLVCFSTSVFAAELLDVNPKVTGDLVTIDISADIPMTYTYYKVPGQARAVVDIAEADPEKVEPLIVVNKGVVSSISVDKAEISNITVSRIIFNLVSEADISVAASEDRKLLTVTFGGSAVVSSPEPAIDSKTDESKEVEPEPLSPAAEVQVQPQAVDNEDDPFGLDEPEVAAVPAAAGAALTAADAAVTETVAATPKLEPVVPLISGSYRSKALSIKEISAGSSYIEIKTNQQISDYKSFRLTKPERLVIDIPSPKINQKAKTVSIRKSGITNARIGISSGNIRVVIDSNRAVFPTHDISYTDNGLKINFR
ncbi:MAG: AMIN domain-containing protein [Desulfuromonadaceae bacterium]|nr:AMIN domain-containing protein [Desulfuromonadaceae bacterium]MDD2854307.1 AMIN domain-containing protein [Desulfuromonadaceae bacterium]